MNQTMEIKSVEDILSDDFECPECNYELQPAIEMATLYYPYIESGKERKTFKARVNEMIEKYNENRNSVFYQYL